MAKDFFSDVDFKSTVTLTSTDAGSEAGPIIELYRNSASPADADYIGQIKFQGENDNDQKVIYAKITGKIDDMTDTTEDGIIEFMLKKAGSNNIAARFTSDALKLINSTGLEVGDGLLTLGSTAVTSTAAELNLLDGSTAGTVVASKAVVVDANKDISSFRNITLTGELDAASLDISGDVDIDGTTNLDAVDIDGNVQIDGTLSVGVDDTGYDVIFYGATSGNAWFWWDESDDALKLGPSTTFDNDGQTNLDDVDIDGNVQLDGTFYVGADGGGYDVRFYGEESGSLFFYDESASNLLIRKQVTNTSTHDPVLLLAGIETADVNLETGAGPGIDFYIPYDGSTSLGASIAAEKRSDTDANNATGLVFKVSGNGVTTPVRAMSILSNGAVVIGDNTTNGPKLTEGTSDTLRIDSGDGTVDIGCMNSSALHIYTDRSTIFLGADSGASIRMTDSQLSPYTNESADLGSSAYTWNKLWLGQGSGFSSGGYWTLRSRDSDRQVMEFTSSERFKKDIVDLPVSEAYQILNARPIKFRGIDDADSVPLEAGLSAESLHEAGFEYAVRYDEGHWGETPRAVYYEMLTAPLIKIVKDLKDRIEALEA